MDKIELIIDDKHDVWHVKTKVELTFDNIEYLKSIPKYFEHITFIGKKDTSRFVVNTCYITLISGKRLEMTSIEFNELILYKSDMSKCFLINFIDNDRDIVFEALENFRKYSSPEEKDRQLIEIEKECSHYECKDEVIYRQKSNDNNFIWTYGIFSHYEGHDNDTIAVINGKRFYLCGYEILPYVGHEDMVGTNK